MFVVTELVVSGGPVYKAFERKVLLGMSRCLTLKWNAANEFGAEKYIPLVVTGSLFQSSSLHATPIEQATRKHLPSADRMCFTMYQHAGGRVVLVQLSQISTCRRGGGLTECWGSMHHEQRWNRALPNREQTYIHDCKHYLPATSLAGGNYGC